MNDEKNPLPLLLVTEAIRELSKRFENLTEKENHIEHHICNLGKKPGFVMISHFSNAQDVENLDDICKIIAGIFSKAVFNVQAKYHIYNNNPTSKKIAFVISEKIPCFHCLTGTPGAQMTQQQQFWFNSYAHFVSGVYCGALLHFGLKASPEFKLTDPPSLTFSFQLEELEKTWEFSANA